MVSCLEQNIPPRAEEPDLVVEVGVVEKGGCGQLVCCLATGAAANCL